MCISASRAIYWPEVVQGPMGLRAAKLNTSASARPLHRHTAAPPPTTISARPERRQRRAKAPFSSFSLAELAKLAEPSGISVQCHWRRRPRRTTTSRPPVAGGGAGAGAGFKWWQPLVTGAAHFQVALIVVLHQPAVW